MILKNKTVSEITQLLLAACNFFEMAKGVYANIDDPHKKIPLEKLGEKFESDGFSEMDEKCLYFVSYLTSCAIRISTIIEVIGLKPKDSDLYNSKILSKNSIDFLCHYLRDNVCHEEPNSDDLKHLNRQNYLDALTPNEVYRNVSKQIKGCFDRIVQIRSDMEAIEKNGKIVAKIEACVI
jgi:hypothetical protein